MDDIRKINSMTKLHIINKKSKIMKNIRGVNDFQQSAAGYEPMYLHAPYTKANAKIKKNQNFRALFALKHKIEIYAKSVFLRLPKKM